MSQDRYHVFWTPPAKESLRQLIEKARPRDLFERLREDVDRLNERLAQAPHEVGEIHRSRGVVHVHVASGELVWIEFAYDTTKKVVAVHRCEATPRGGLAD